MIGLHILAHSIQMILRNLWHVLQLGLVPLIALLVGVGSLSIAIAKSGVAGGGGIGPMLFLIFFCVMFPAIWFAVNWHRFILLEEYPRGFFPPVPKGEMWRYFGYSFLIGFLVLLMAIPLMMLTFGALAAAGSANFFSFQGMIEFGAILLFTAVAMRLGLILPAVSIGEKSALGAMWGKTSGHSGAIFTLAFCIAVIGQAFEYLPSVLPTGLLSVSFIVVSQLFLVVLNISILTSLYGHYVEGRPVTG